MISFKSRQQLLAIYILKINKRLLMMKYFLLILISCFIWQNAYTQSSTPHFGYVVIEVDDDDLTKINNNYVSDVVDLKTINISGIKDWNNSENNLQQRYETVLVKWFANKLKKEHSNPYRDLYLGNDGLCTYSVDGNGNWIFFNSKQEAINDRLKHIQGEGGYIPLHGLPDVSITLNTSNVVSENPNENNFKIKIHKADHADNYDPDFADKLYNTRPIIFPESSEYGLFLQSENLKFNYTKSTQNNIESDKKKSSDDEDQIAYTKDYSKTLIQDYHPEPPVTQILDEVDVKEKKDDKETLWDKWIKGLPLSFNFIGDQLISEKTIENPIIRELIEKNGETIKSFSGRVENIFETSFEGGTESQNKAENELYNLQTGLENDLIGTHINSTVDVLENSIEDEIEDRMSVDPIAKESINAIKTILSFSKKEDPEDE